MIYSNLEFFLLFGITSILYISFSNRIFRLALLIISSLSFYSWAGFFDSLVFLLVVCAAWISAYLSTRVPKYRKSILAFGILFLLFHLVFWKYGGWILRSIQQVFPNLIGGREFYLPLPVGISFFTLQGIAYLVDLFRGKARLFSFTEFLFFKSFFSQLIAGPIVLYSELAKPIALMQTPRLAQIRSGIALILLGLFKKVVIADRIGAQVDLYFNQPAQYTQESLLWATLGFGIQLWADFSGYTDMGRGTARVLGFELPENFFSPYLSSSFKEFWKRWHATLTRWLHDYIYQPLTDGHLSHFFFAIAIVLTFLLGGLWHGAGLTFLLWGLLHGLILLVELKVGKTLAGQKWRNSTFLRFAGTIYVFILFHLSLILFRAQSFDGLKTIWSRLEQAAGGQDTIDSTVIFYALLATLLIQCLDYRSIIDFKRPTPIQNLVDFFNKIFLKLEGNFGGRLFQGILIAFINFGILFLILYLRYKPSTPPFIYFQF